MKVEWLGTCINWMDQLDGKMLHRDTFENNIIITTRTAERCTFVLVIHGSIHLGETVHWPASRALDLPRRRTITDYHARSTP